MTRIRREKPGIVKRVIKACLLFLGLFLVLSVLQVAVLRFVNPPFTGTMISNWVADKMAGREAQWPDPEWRPLRKISPHLRRSALAGEDQRFTTHNGFDFVEMNQAFQDVLTGGRVRGASTITMQVARTVFLWPGRSLARKSLEAYYTVLIEVFWSKKRILEVYLNTVDWGKDVVGAEMASRKYFQTNASYLTAEQAALLAAVLPSPHQWSPEHPTEYVRERQRRILGDMRKMPLL
ncbi:MAG TPA: monofunctional biosynthetic peptidoglycan transglycosylase [Desulfatiglandales bacterium]